MYEDENKRDIHARSSSAARHASSRRREIEYEWRTSSPAAVSLVLFSSQCSLSPPSLVPIKGWSLLSERRTRISSSSRHKFLSTALLLSSSSRLAACTASRDSRPPEPQLLSPVRKKGDKVFGERSARLLAASSRMIRSPTTTSLTTTSS